MLFFGGGIVVGVVVLVCFLEGTDVEELGEAVESFLFYVHLTRGDVLLLYLRLGTASGWGSVFAPKVL